MFLHTGLGNMQAWRHGQDCMESMLPQRVSLVAPQNVMFHPMGQLAPPTLDGFLSMHLHCCTHPKGPRAAVNPMEQGCHVHPNRGAEVPTAEPHRIQAAVPVVPQRQVDRAIRPYCVLKLVLSLVEEGLSRQVLDESLLPRVKVSCVGYPHQRPAIPHKLSIVLNQAVRQRPLGEVREDDPQKAGFHNASQWILHTHCHHILPSVGHGALKVKQLISTAW